MKARVHVFYKDGVFDPQGNTISQALRRMGFSTVQDVRMGKAIDVELNTTSHEQASRDLKRMCEELLANPVIESYRFEILDAR